MATKERESGAYLKKRLFREFYRFSFFKAVDILESLFPERKPLGKSLMPGEEAVRFSSKPGLSFPASDISKLEHSDEKKPVDMEVAFMGFIGPSGVLPHWYNEQAIERAFNKDFSLSAFYDMFHHRLISLFYLAWKKHRLSATYLRGEKDRISACFLSLIGLGTPGLMDLIGLPEKSLLYFYSGLLSRTVPSSSAIEATVGYFSGASVRVEQFIERLLPLSPEDQTQIGLANGQLGIDTVCGSFVWENQTKFKVFLGPIGYDSFLSFLPDGRLHRPTFSLIRYMVGIEYEFEICLILKRDEVPPCVLGTKLPAPPMLGCSTWIKNPDYMHDHDPSVSFQVSEV